MARTALTPELKAVRALKELWNQRNFERYHFAFTLLSDDTMLLDVIPTAIAIIEIAAVRADHGDFDEDTREWVMAAYSMRNALADHLRLSLD